MQPVESNRPIGGSPGADQDRTIQVRAQPGEQCRPNPRTLISRCHIGVANQCHVLNRLDAHQADQPGPGDLVPVKDDASGDLVGQLLGGHVGVLPPIVWDNAPIGLRGLVDDRKYAVEIVLRAVPDYSHTKNAPNSRAINFADRSN